MKRLLLLVLPSLLACNEKTYYTASETSASSLFSGRNNNPTVRDGKCYKNCLISDRYETNWASFPIYTGSDAKAPLETKQLMVEPSKSKFVKKNEFICFVETPAVMKGIQVLADTVRYKDFRFELFEYKKLAEKGGFSREVEVVCVNERTPNLYMLLSAALKAQGYLRIPAAKWNNELSQALNTFQRDNSLPVGDIDYETLGFLGVANW